MNVNMKKKFLLPAMLLAAVFASCNSEENPAQAESRAALGVNVQLKEMSRAGMVSGQALPDDDPIGVSLVAADYSDYDDKTAGYINIAYKGPGYSGYTNPSFRYFRCGLCLLSVHKYGD